jgi:hypothetical protein
LLLNKDTGNKVRLVSQRRVYNDAPDLVVN